jgi:hypothetical protein
MPVWAKADFDQFYSAGAERWGHPNTRPQIGLGYHWATFISAQMGVSVNGLISDNFPQLLFDVLSMNSGDSVLIVGAGFNGTGAGLAALGIDVIGIDTSPYIDAEKSQTEEAEIRAAIIAAGLDPDVDKIRGPGGPDADPLDLFLEGGRASPQPRGKGTVLPEDMSKRNSRNTIKAALASTPRYAISEEVLNSITDAEALQVCDYAANFASENGGTIVHMLSPFQPDTTQAPELNWKTYAGWRTFLDANGFSAQLILPTVTAWDQGETPLSVDLPNRPNTVTAYSGVF